jgi:hypothetical protein
VPDPSIQDVVFSVAAADCDRLRAAWSKALAHCAPSLAAKQVDPAPRLERTLDEWSAAYQGFDSLVSTLIRQKAAWTSIAPLTRAKIKTAARTLQGAAGSVAAQCAEALTAIQALDEAARVELAAPLTAMARRAAEHQTRAAVTARGR